MKQKAILLLGHNRFMFKLVYFIINGKIKPFMVFLGRILMSQIFIVAGISKLFSLSGTAIYMTSKGIPFIPFLLTMAVVFELGGGISLLFGYKARFGALMLILFLIPTTLIFHNFWAFPLEYQQLQMAMFMKNLAIMGGLCMLVSYGPSSISLDRR